METGLAQKGILVTGGAGGIGSAVVRAFAAEGARVAVHYRSQGDAAAQLAAEVGGVALHADLTVEAEADALVPAAVAALGRLDVTVANAGVWPSEDRRCGRFPWSGGRRRCAPTSRSPSSPLGRSYATPQSRSPGRS